MARFCAVLSLFLLVGVYSTGCTFQRQRTNIKDFYNRVAAVVPGETKTNDVPEILGSPPNNIIPLENGGAILLYTFGDAKTGGFNIIILNFGVSNIGIDSAIFISDAKGIVQEVNVSTNSQELTYDWWPFGA